AVNGKWMDAPGQDLFRTIQHHLGDVPIIAEDLGVITPDVEALRDGFHLPGMKILQFAFDSAEENDFLPHNYTHNCIVYTGTHDNETVKGWFANAKPEDKHFALEYVHGTVKTIHWDMIRTAWSSVADTAIAPMQDFLGAGNNARMNLPGSTANNWQWRMKGSDLTEALAKKIADITVLYARAAK
ncbi:MAG: 4-alpha-glucanotransferase, partial [Chitinophagales bacterium]